MKVIKYAESYENMLPPEKERFQQASRKLLNKCMLVRDKNAADRDDYVFLNDHFDMLLAFLDALGYAVLIDRDAGVIRYYVPGDDQTNVYRLGITDKITLWCLFQLYNEKIEKSRYTYVDIRFSDLVDLFEKYGLKDRFGKHGAENSLGVMKKFNIVSTQRKEMKADSIVRILPSIKFSLNESELRDYASKGDYLLKAEQDKAKREKSRELRNYIEQEEEEEEDE